MTLPETPNQGHADTALVQALADLAQARLHLALLEEEYQDLQQRYAGHLKRAQLLSDALANERTTRLSMQARVAELERQKHYLQEALDAIHSLPDDTGGTLQERAIGE